MSPNTKTRLVREVAWAACLVGGVLFFGLLLKGEDFLDAMLFQYSHEEPAVVWLMLLLPYTITCLVRYYLRLSRGVKNTGIETVRDQESGGASLAEPAQRRNKRLFWAPVYFPIMTVLLCGLPSWVAFTQESFLGVMVILVALAFLVGLFVAASAWITRRG